jgi:hypothetical protein
VTGEGNEVHVAMVTRLEADCCASWDVEPLTTSCNTIELQSGIRFSEVEM